jgi:uncharacterized protein YjcR
LHQMPTFLRADDLANRWGVSPGTLANWRVRGVGPAFVKISNGAVRYALADVESYEAAGRTKAAA